MSMSASRAMLRQTSRLTRRTARRFESTTAKVTDAAKDTASKATGAAKDTASKTSQTAAEYKSKASEGLSRVTSSAGPAISGAAKSVGNALGRVGGRTGRLIGFVESKSTEAPRLAMAATSILDSIDDVISGQIPPTIYYARVGLELSKLVFQGQKMAPPPLSTFQQYFQSLLKGFRNPSNLFSQASRSGNTTPEGILSSIRSMNTTQLTTYGVVFAEILGFFTIGEMIGRFKLVGYRGEKGAHH